MEKKSDTWIVAILVEGIENGKVTENVSINKTNKDGTIAFKEFDTLMPGHTIEGNLWQNPSTHKFALYPNRPAPKNDGEVVARSTPTRSFGGGAKAMETKAANIEKAQETTFKHVTQAQENKNKGIMLAAAFRDATIMLTNMPAYNEMTFEEIRTNHKAIVEWYVSGWNSMEETIELPF